MSFRLVDGDGGGVAEQFAQSRTMACSICSMETDLIDSGTSHLPVDSSGKGGRGRERGRAPEAIRPNGLETRINIGRPCGIRTCDQRIKSPLLYQLS